MDIVQNEDREFIWLDFSGHLWGVSRVDLLFKLAVVKGLELVLLADAQHICTQVVGLLVKLQEIVQKRYGVVFDIVVSYVWGHEKVGDYLQKHLGLVFLLGVHLQES